MTDDKPLGEYMREALGETNEPRAWEEPVQRIVDEEIARATAEMNADIDEEDAFTGTSGERGYALFNSDKVLAQVEREMKHSVYVSRLTPELRPERMSHTEVKLRGRAVVLWETIVFALYRRLAAYVDRRTTDDTEWVGLEFRDAYPERSKIVTVYDETEAEHTARLQRLVAIGHQRPVVYDSNVPDGMAFLFDARRPDIHIEGD